MHNSIPPVQLSSNETHLGATKAWAPAAQAAAITADFIFSLGGGRKRGKSVETVGRAIVRTKGWVGGNGGHQLRAHDLMLT